MHCAKVSPQPTNLSQSVSSLPLDIGHSEVTLFEKFPVEKLFGQRFRNDIAFEGTDMSHDFKIIKITGQVMWKYQPSSDADTKTAKLKIKRLRASVLEETIFEELKLAEYDNSCSPDADGFIKQSFDFSADSHTFWQQGEKGMLELDHVASHSFCC